MLKAIARAITAAVRSLLRLPFDLLDWLFGSSGSGSAPAVPEGRTSAEDLREDFAQAAARHEGSRQAMAEVSSVGEIVHAYACEPSDTRWSVNLYGVPDHVKDWLLDRSDDDLWRLSKAGPAACSRAAKGQKCGIVGIELPKTYEAAATGLAETSTLDILQARIRNRMAQSKDHRAA